MRRAAAFAAILTLLVTAVATPANAGAGNAGAGRDDGYRKVGYFTQWGIYGRAFPVKKLDTSGAAARLTHINYAFGNVSADGRCFIDNIPARATPGPTTSVRCRPRRASTASPTPGRRAARRQLRPARRSSRPSTPTSRC